MRRFHSSKLAVLTLLLITAWIYAPALDFGFIWDDPLWYGRVVGKSVWELIQPMPDYHFYRPGTMLYYRLFLTSDSAYVPPLLHAAQIGWHLLNIALIYALNRRLGLGNWVAVAIAGLVALFPFSYQAVAWAAPQQPLVMALQTGAWLTYIEARRHQANRNLAVSLSLLLFLVALTVQESTVALSGLPLIIEWVRHRQGAGRAGWWLALAYPIIAGGFGLMWLQIPREVGYTTLIFDNSVVLYLFQGFVFPLLGRPAGYGPGYAISPGALLLLIGLVIGALLVAAWCAGRGRLALFGLTWALLGIAPSAAGLRYSYVRLASRLLYYSSAGVALLWTCALLPRVVPKTRGNGLSRPTCVKSLLSSRRLWQVGGIILVALMFIQSYLLLIDFRRMYTIGVTHLHQLNQAVQAKVRAGDLHLLFVNFPDRYAPKRPPYPLGYWGVTLAPVSVDLGAFPAAAIGQHPYTVERRMPSIDFDAREAGPYQIDMRGEITSPDELYQLAHQVDSVYLSRYSPDGTVALEWAGAVTTTPSTPSCQLARFGQTICLQESQIDRQPGRLSLTLTWLSLSSAQPHDTIFAHVGTADQPPIAQSDDDACLGLLPMSTWLPGDVIREQRIISLPDPVEPAQYEIRLGVYNRASGARLTAALPDGQPLEDDVIVVGRSR